MNENPDLPPAENTYDAETNDAIAKITDHNDIDPSVSSVQNSDELIPDSELQNDEITAETIDNTLETIEPIIKYESDNSEINPSELTEISSYVANIIDEKNTVNDKDEDLSSGAPVKKKVTKPRLKKSSFDTAISESLESLDIHDFNPEDEEHELETSVTQNYLSISKEELIERLEELVKNTQISKIKSDISGIKVAYISLSKAEKESQLSTYLANGGTKEDYIPEPDPLEERFKQAFDIYKENKIRDDQEQEKAKAQNLVLKKQILEEIKQLINSDDSLKKTYDAFKALQEKWKLVGMVPRNEIEGLWNNYHFLVDKFFEKVKINKELKDLDLKKNLEAKISLCEKAEELLLEKSITKSFKLLQKYHEEWKEIGPVIQDKKDEIWERFKNVSDNINQQRRDYYESLHKEQESNLLAKTALCEKIEEINSIEITNITDWKEKTEQVLEMQKLWDSIGRAQIKFHDDAWERFRAAINVFFKNKKTYFGELKDQHFNNYNLKLGICAQVEELLNTNNWKQATAEVIKLQQDWKNIGPVPKRYSDKVWKKFRTACDDFFTKKTSYFSNIHGVEQENRKKKEELLQRVNNYQISSDKKENLENLKNFQREWVEIGFVPMDVKEKLHNEFKNAINALMNKLKISSAEVSTLNYKNKIENLQNSPDSKNSLYKERIFIEGKLKTIKSEILQWENNLGFFASSKKADLLKQEFEKKIQNAKQEQALLEAKLKLLKSQE